MSDTVTAVDALAKLRIEKQVLTVELLSLTPASFAAEKKRIFSCGNSLQQKCRVWRDTQAEWLKRRDGHVRRMAEIDLQLTELKAKAAEENRQSNAGNPGNTVAAILKEILAELRAIRAKLNY